MISSPNCTFKEVKDNLNKNDLELFLKLIEKYRFENSINILQQYIHKQLDEAKEKKKVKHNTFLTSACLSIIPDINF